MIPCLDPLKAIVDSKIVGTHYINGKFNYDTEDLNFAAANSLGNITLKVAGEFIAYEGAGERRWAFNGKIEAEKDIYDDNPMPDARSDIAEQKTTFLRKLGDIFGGTEYDILIPGEIDVQLNNNVTKMPSEPWLFD